ncbi:hypothetical protein LDO26_01215 [Luteimonas sp. BDR2-5]|uniref:Ig-like domain-containing protein n=1 Tax=Proluteimonas luteida TaxID=2878685 RepID=UPI001E547892|nr:Ig-like domain-containing protein [Luteimonas sp. BDR2-5]MCD9026836.1 hypothetical protein [Luteimonas sp. BDR2-5]
MAKRNHSRGRNHMASHSTVRTGARNAGASAVSAVYRRIGAVVAIAALMVAAAILPGGKSLAADLRIAEGVVVKLGDEAQIVVRDRLVVGNGVLLTSQLDDAAGGQTNPEPGMPAAGDWSGLRIEKTAQSFGIASLSGVVIRYAGGSDADAAGITLRGVSPQIDALQVEHSHTGLSLQHGAAPAITGSSFRGNAVGIEASGNSGATVTGSQIVESAAFAVRNRTPETPVQATGNWWGHATGPLDPAGNAGGQGGSVTPGVVYANFLPVAPILNPTVRPTAPAQYYDSRLVSFELSAVNAVDYRIAENGQFAGIPFQTLQAGRAIAQLQFSDGDGLKVVTAQFRNAAGQMVTATLPSGVMIDTQPPAVAFATPAPGSFISENIRIEVNANDLSGIREVRLYQADTLLHTATAAPYRHDWNVDSLDDGDYTLRAVAMDGAGRTGESILVVTVSRGVPVPDTEGPVLSNIAANGVPLANGATFSSDALLTFSASDRSAISRIELLLDGQVRAVATQTGTGTYSVPLSIQGIANGPHQVALRGFDSLDNVSTVQYAIEVAHAGPAAPVITQPANGLNTRSAGITVAGTSVAGSAIRILRNGDLAVETTAGSGGAFSAPVQLVAGVNTLQAVALNQNGTSAPSAEVVVTLDVSVPTAPTTLSASLFNGRIRLLWTVSSDPNAVGYEVYRSTSVFEATGEAQRVASLGQNASSHEEMPEVDGTYYYRVVSINAAGTPSLPTSLVSATIDRTPPHVVSIQYATDGAHDAGRGVYGQGTLSLVVDVSEPLQGTPYLSLVPTGGLPIPVDLVRQTETRYSGSLVLGPGAGSGEANILFSARDVAGNRGDQVLQGATVQIDTIGPALTGIELAPNAPINVENSRNVQATLQFNEQIPTGTPPSVQYRLSGVGRVPVPLEGVQRLVGDRWRVTFELPADAGADGVEDLSFDFVATDALGNASSAVNTSNLFQVYQGELPALNVPLSLSARALPGGRVGLEWLAVAGATSYQLYRQAPGESERTPLARSAEAEYVDSTPVDGGYRYTVASVRSANGQESLSGESLPVEVTSSRTAPGAPQNLQLVLTSQGIGATWQPPVGPAPTGYRLYRSANSPITSVEGLTPIRDNIRTTQAVDPVPSQSEHAYVVTAIDAAGNESAISNSAYLNFSLLPVRSLLAEQIGATLPVVRWTPNGTGAIGFDVYVGEGDDRVKLTPAPTTATELTDTGFTSGQRLYTVEAVDENGERQARSLLLPNISTQVVSGLPLKRNVMNRVNVQVSNLSASSLDSARVVLTVGARNFLSEEFVLAGNATRLVPVIVGGYADLPASAPMTVAVRNEPHEGEQATVGTVNNVTATDSALVVGMETDNFVRGATGSVRLVVENTSEVEVELLTARNFGSAASHELRFKLLDMDGNLLSSTPYLQAMGAGVITVPTGETVARIAPGQRYVSDTFLIPIPGSSPDQVKLRLEVDALRYNTGQTDHVAIPGMGSERNVALSNTPYYGEIASVSPVISFGGQEITILGRSVDRATGDSVRNVPLRIAVNQEGFERMANVTTDETGGFRYVYTPTVTDSGLYHVGAIHPDMTDRPQQGQFTINRVSVSPGSFRVTVPRNYAYRIDFRASTGAGAQATNVHMAYLAEYQSSGTLMPGIRVESGTPLNIGPRQNLALPVSFSGDNSAAPSGRIFLAAFADGATEPLAIVPVDYTLTDATPVLHASPNYIETGLSRGQSLVESVQIENRGFVAMEDVTAALLDTSGNPAPQWVALASPPALGSIAIGEKRSLDISIAPTELVGEGIHEFRLRLAGSNMPTADVNVFVSVTQSGQGSVLFKAADIYTATRDSDGNLIPGLAGARITLQNELVASQSYDATTDVYGEAFFQDLPAGSYRYRASGPNHNDAGGRVVIRPGITVNQSVFLDYTLIQVEWSVREISIEDRYEITLHAIFETDVPAAVVVLQPTSITLPSMAAGEVFQGELILTNYGLIRADAVVPQLPSDDEYFKFEFLAQPPTSLEAKQRVRLPYRIIALRALDSGEDDPPEVANMEAGGDEPGLSGGEGSGQEFAGADFGAGLMSGGGGVGTASSTGGTGGCFTYTATYRIGCLYVCANGEESTNCGSASTWVHVVSRSCPSSWRPGGGAGGIGGGGWGGSGGGNWGSLPGLPPCVRGAGDCFESPSGQSGGGKEGGQ